MPEVKAGAAARFEDLPDDARARGPVVRALYGGISRATLWRWVRDGLAPAPSKLGGVSSWRVGDLRADLARKAQG